MVSTFKPSKAYSSVPFEDRPSCSDDVVGHYALILTTYEETLVKIVDIISNAYPCRKLELAYNHEFGRHLGLPRHPCERVEMKEDRLIPVDPSVANWREKAHAWRAEQRQKALDSQLPSASPTRPASPRF